MAHPYSIAIQKVFAAHKNDTVAKGAKAYLLNQFEFYGIKTPIRRKLSKDFYKALKSFVNFAARTLTSNETHQYKSNR